MWDEPCGDGRPRPSRRCVASPFGNASNLSVSLTAPERNPTKAAVALLLTFTAGLVDIAGFIKLYQVFTAHMTGVTVHLGHNIVEGQWHNVLLGGAVLLSFVGGSVAGRSIIELGARRAIRRIATITLSLEAVLIALVAAISLTSMQGEVRLWLLAMLAFSMGLQTATLTRVGPLTVHTTFVTGMLNKLAQLLSHALFHHFDSQRDPSQVKERNRVLRQAGFIFSIWMLYFTGAAVGSVLTLAIGLRSLFIAVAVLVIAIIADQVHPLSLQEEKNEAEPQEIKLAA
jgi:uncharacterized membrane protein YoaK (UPF0700 family)